MPPRYSYWTILAGGLPTAFRAANREELEPTFRRLREKHPDAEMKWFARGKLWASPEAARADRPYRDRDAGSDARGGPARRGAPPSGEFRGRDWRPGGEHRDPRQKYKDAKKARNVERRQEKFARKQGSETWRDRPPREKPHGDKRASRASTDRRFDRPAGPPRNDWRDRAGGDKPHGDKLRPGARRFPEGGNRPGGGHPPRQERPHETRGPRDRPMQAKGDWRARPPREKPGGKFPPRGAGNQRFDRSAPPPRSDWRDRPPREKPHGEPLTRGSRPFDRKSFPRGQGVEEEPAPPRPRGPNREPKPSESPQPTPPPRPSEPAEPPSAPPERGGSGKYRKPRPR